MKDVEDLWKMYKTYMKESSQKVLRRVIYTQKRTTEDIL